MIVTGYVAAHRHDIGPTLDCLREGAPPQCIAAGEARDKAALCSLVCRQHVLSRIDICPMTPETREKILNFCD